jgi:hypothetical protein
VAIFRSLRFRVPALFLAGIVLAGIVSTVIAIELLQKYARSESLSDLRREAAGLTQLYAKQAVKSTDEGTAPPYFAPLQLEQATGDRLYYVGPSLFPGQPTGLRKLRPLSRQALDWRAIQAGRTLTFEFTPPDEDRTFLADAHPLDVEGTTFGALVVAKPNTALRTQWLQLTRFFGVSLLGGLLVAAGLAW